MSGRPSFRSQSGMAGQQLQHGVVEERFQWEGNNCGSPGREASEAQVAASAQLVNGEGEDNSSRVVYLLEHSD